jgi:hypothetical protein
MRRRLPQGGQITPHFEPCFEPLQYIVYMYYMCPWRDFAADANRGPNPLKSLRPAAKLALNRRERRFSRSPLPEARQVEALVAGALDGDLVAGVGVAHDAGGGVVP